MWFDARTSVNRDSRVVILEETKVTEIKFPNATAENEAWLKSVIEAEIPNWGNQISYDVLVAQLALVEQEQSASERLNNKPPDIVYATKPTVLIMVDGEPKLKAVEGTGLQTVVNTPYFIVQDNGTKVWYLKGRETWYTASDVMGPWSAMQSSSPPKAVTELAAKAVSTPPDSVQADDGKPIIPAVVVRTKPAEVIQTDGEPKFEPVKNTNLLYVENSEDDIIMDIDSQQYYVLVAGRWYTTRSLAGGPWAYCPGDQLPKDFPNIPAESDLGDVRSNVPGTTEAKEAVLENSIPQTASVDRKTATVDVKYDGEPKFEKIEGTQMSYAINTDKSVLLIGGRYYCCDKAVWFESDKATGPWTVSTKVPADVQSIPPDNPLYNVKYVYIYDSTPEVVYVGYTPAYYGSYVYGGVRGVRNRVPLRALVRRVLLPAPGDVRLCRSLQPVHGMGILVRNQLRLDDGVVRRLRRVLGSRRLRPRISPRVSPWIPARLRRGGTSPAVTRAAASIIITATPTRTVGTAVCARRRIVPRSSRRAAADRARA